MAEEELLSEGRSSKRMKRSHEFSENQQEGLSLDGVNNRPLHSLSRSITPPTTYRRQLSVKKSSLPQLGQADQPEAVQIKTELNVIPSPVQLTHIRDLSGSSGHNAETVRLGDILGDPLIKECWQFNFLFDVDFLMNQFDPDVRSLVKVKVVHGSWKRDAPNRIRIDEACSRYPNVEPIVAYMPEPFGTHHSKMMILIRHDDCAQVIIHTANMIPGDWANMCQAVWRSPLLPVMAPEKDYEHSISGDIGSGCRFKRDFLAYLDAYGRKKTGALVEQLKKYDFETVRAALIGSIPSRQEVLSLCSEKETLWGWPALRDIIRRIPIRKQPSSQPNQPHIVAQISSIASLGQTDKWLKDTFFASLCPSSTERRFARFSVIFPTPDEIRRSLNGYGSGGSIHMKLQSSTQQKQLGYMRPFLCRWAGDCQCTSGSDASHPSSVPLNDSKNKGDTQNTIVQEAGRRRAAPHIKTFVRFSDAEDMHSIDWAMVTSANLSTQAWGAGENAKHEVRICSWEIGVLIWPDLFVNHLFVNQTNAGDNDSETREEKKKNQYAQMVPCFRKNTPCLSEVERYEMEESSEKGHESGTLSTLVGFRMPYDLPLTPYSSRDVPWCATASHPEPDWLGQTWEEE